MMFVLKDQKKWKAASLKRAFLDRLCYKEESNQTCHQIVVVRVGRFCEKNFLGTFNVIPMLLASFEILISKKLNQNFFSF